MEDNEWSEISKVIEIIGKYQWIINSSLVGFYRDKLWKKLPKDWRFSLEQVSPIDTNFLPFGHFKVFF